MSETTTTAIDALDDPEVGVTWRRLPRTFGIRRRLKLSVEDFAVRYHIPVDMVRAWEDGRAVPDAAVDTYLLVIARDPAHVAALLADSVKDAAE